MREQPMTRGIRSSLWAVLCLALVSAFMPGDSPVADAAMRGEKETVRTLLKAGEDVNAAQGDGMTALHWAALHGDVELAKMLVYAGANVKATTRLGEYTPLILASREGIAPMIAALLEAGADANGATSTGAAPLHFAAASGQVDAVTALLEHGADPNIRERASGQTPLMFAAANNRAAVITALVRHGADPSIESKVVDARKIADADAAARRRRNAMIAAARTGTAAGGQRGGDPTAELQSQEEDGQRAGGGRGGRRAQAAGAQAAGTQAAGAQAAGAQVAGAQAAATQAAGTRAAGAQAAGAQTAGAQAADAGRAGGGRQGGAAGRTTAEASADELQGRDGEAPARKPGDPDPPQPLSYNDLVGAWGGLTPLLHASRQGNVEAVRALLDAGADINQVSGSDQTSPLLAATINGHFDLAMLLLAGGAAPNLASHAGVTPLYGVVNVQWAPHAFYPQPSPAQQKTTHLELLKALFEHGADPNIRLTMKVWYTGYNFDQSGVDETGATAFWRAAQASDVEAMRLLVAHGADPDIWSKVLPERRAPNGRNSGDNLNQAPPVPVGGPAASPLHIASGAGFDGNFHRNAPVGWLPAVKYLVEELGFDVNAPDYKGYTPLHNAAFRGDNEMIRYLVSKGADVMAVARSGQTTVDMANGPIQRLQPFPETIALLEGLGAKNNHKCVSC